MGSKRLAGVRNSVVQRVTAGQLAAKDAYNALGGGAFTHGEFETLEAKAKAQGLGQWASLSAADRSAAAGYQPWSGNNNTPSKSDQRANALGVNTRDYAATGGKLLPAAVTGSGSWSQASSVAAPKAQPAFYGAPKPAKGYSLAVAPNEEMPNHLPPGYAERARAKAAGEYGPFLSELNPEERARVDRAGEAYDRANGAGKLNTPYTYRSAAGGVVDPTLDQRPQFNPLSNPGYKAPAGSTPMPGTAAPGAYNNEVGFKPAAPATTGPKVAGYALPGQSAYAGLANRFDEKYVNGLLTANKNQADDQYARSQQEITASLASRGLLNAPPSGVQYQMENEARMARDNALAGAGLQARLDATKSAADFDITQAGGLDSFGFNKGNLALGYSADARQGQLLPAQLRAANAGASSAESQALIGNQDAWEYGTQDAANIRAALRASGLEGVGLDLALKRLGITGAEIGNQGALLGNDGRRLDNDAQNALNYESARTREDRVAAVRAQLDGLVAQNRITTAQAAQAEFLAQNQGILAALAFLSNLVPGATKAAGAK